MEMKMIMYMTLLSNSIIMLFMKHPLSMGLLILLQSIFISIFSGMLVKTYWFSYILFLTFLGGLLVLFIYLCSVASNDMFKYSIKINMFIVFSMLLTFMIYLYEYMYNYNFWLNFFLNSEMINFIQNSIFFNEENKLSLFKLYDNQIMLMFMLIIYLFITLVAVIKITNIFMGPLRSSF